MAFRGFEEFGASQSGDGQVEFKVFFPGPGLGPYQYRWGGAPCIESLKVFGTFQAPAWDAKRAVVLKRQDYEGGLLYSEKVSGLRPDFYEHALIVEFDDGTSRVVGDPCAKYGGSGGRGTSGFVIDEPGYRDVEVSPLANRKALRNLIVYEVMLDDFTAGYRGDRAPVAAFLDKLGDIRKIGFNAVELMPWTTWPFPEFSWGYNPSQFFAVEYRYVNDPDNARCKIDGLKKLIAACHEKGMQVIMDGVFNHTCADRRGRGYPYYWLYQDPGDCPFIGAYAGGGFMEELDYLNPCTESFIRDVCKYWIKEFKVDGLRLDYTKGYFDPSDLEHGLPKLIADLRKLAPEVSVTIEHLDGYGAIAACNRAGADSCWYDPFYWESRASLYRLREWIGAPVEHRDEGKSPVQPSIVRLLDSATSFDDGANGTRERCPTTYVENHDHAQVASNAGGRANWFRSQPWAIAQFTSYGAVLCHNGQEQADDYFIPEDGERVVPRPVIWSESNRSESDAARALYGRLAKIRTETPALRSRNFHPKGWDEQWRRRRDGFGIDCDRGIVVYHRWVEEAGVLERVIVALNFADYQQAIDIPMSAAGVWDELLEEWTVSVGDDGGGCWLRNHGIPRYWGRIFRLRTPVQ